MPKIYLHGVIVRVQEGKPTTCTQIHQPISETQIKAILDIFHNSQTESNDETDQVLPRYESRYGMIPI